MDQRLIPINGLIALLRGDGGWPRTLGDAGFQRYQLEMPLSTPKGEVRVDALIYRLSPDLILLCECKSGKNIEAKQAGRYRSVNVEWLQRIGAIPPQLRQSQPIAVQTLYVGTEDHRPDLEQGLQELGSVPLLTIGADRVQLSGVGRTPGLADFIERHNGGLPPARIPVDHQSDDDEILELLIPAIVAAQASLEDIVEVESLCQAVLPEWPVLGARARAEFTGRVTQLVKGLVAGEMKGQFRYEPRSGRQPHLPARVVILESPAKRDPRGRTQAFQAQQNRAERVLRRKSRKVPIPGQTSLDDLAQEGGLADE